MDRSELLARTCVESALPGSRMRYREHQHARTFDFDLHLPDGTLAALEVSAAADPIHRSTQAAILDDRKGGQLVPRKLAQRDWYVHPASDAPINRIRANIDAYLSVVEQEGRDEFSAPTDVLDSPAVERIWRELKVESGKVTRWRTPGIGIALLGGGGWLSDSPVWEAVRSVAEATDNREKLAVSGRDQRHLFVYVDDSLPLAWLCLREMQAGHMKPMPPEVTYLWVAGAYGGKCVVLHGATADRELIRMETRLPEVGPGVHSVDQR